VGGEGSRSDPTVPIRGHLMHRISIRNKVFSVDGEDIQNAVTAVIVNASTVQRAYYPNAFDPNTVQTPVCWSADTQYPSQDATEIQSKRCMDCRHNIRGGASDGGRSCKFSQKLALAFSTDLRKVYQLHVPANSIFGRGQGNFMPLQEYARFLQRHDTVSTDIYTKIYFDENSIVPKLFFSPKKPLSVSEQAVVEEVVNHPDTTKLIALDFSSAQQSSSPFEKTEGFTITT